MNHCPRCGAALEPEVVQGLCPRCLLEAALVPAPEPADIGDYTLTRRLGRGGMGTVYRAHRTNPDRTVALKMLRGGDFADEHDLRRFRSEAQLLAALHHPNIVPIYEYGEHAGGAWYTMRLMEGGTLAEAMPRLRENRAEACNLLAVVARAVHFGHQHAILHRDLKPANVLLDRDGVPSVADFGTARLLTDGRGLTHTNALIGTPEYMAPEQASGNPEAVSVCADVYSLGAILYELLTGQPPHSAESREELLRRVADTEPVRPGTLVPGLERKLETICLKCLERNPEQRYRSAAELAEDLEAFVRGDPIKAEPVGRLARSWRFALRHPVATGIIATLAAAALSGALVARDQERALRRDVLAANTHAARMAAGHVLLQFRDFADQLQQVRSDPTLVALLEREDWKGLERAPLPHALSEPSGKSIVDSYLLLDAHGVSRGRWPLPPDYFFGKDFTFRDYFKGARNPVHVSDAFVSETDGGLKFAITGSLVGSDGGVAGILSTHVAADSVLGQVQLGGGPGRVVALVGRLDRDRDGGHVARQVFLTHQGLVRGSTVPFDAEGIEGFARLEPDASDAGELTPSDEARVATADDYRDPFPGFEGHYLVGIAPVGHTSLALLVQTRYDTTAPWQRVGVLLGAPLALGLLFAGALSLSTRRRRRGPATPR